jgi:hypothetical protein
MSFALAGITCLFSALSYGELASTIPVSGSAYTYGYATLGELVGWIIGWDLILEYGVSVAAVAVGWGGYVQSLLDSLFGISLPDSISAPPGEGGSFNLPSLILVLAVTAVLIYGIRESARTNTIMVFIKIAILSFFILVGVGSISGDNFSPWAPKGVAGTVDAAALIFFAYIGFDAVSTSGEEATNAQRDLPIAIIGSLLIATLLYILVAIVAVGLAPQDQLAGSDAPLSDAIKIGVGLDWAGDLLSFGALVAITSVTLTILYGQTRIFFRDEPRRPAARGLRPPQHTPDAVDHHADVRHPHRGHGGAAAAERDRQARQHRHAVRVPDREPRRDHPAPHAARPRARLPRAVRARVPAHRRCAVHLPDDAPRARHVAAVPRVAGARARHLRRLRPHPLAPAARRGTGHGAREARRVGPGAPERPGARAHDQ